MLFLIDTKLLIVKPLRSRASIETSIGYYSYRLLLVNSTMPFLSVTLLMLNASSQGHLAPLHGNDCYEVLFRFSVKRASAYATDSPNNVQASLDVPLPVTQAATISNEDDAEIERKFANMGLVDRPGYVPDLPSVNDTQHHKADMLVAYATVNGEFVLC